MFKFLIGLIVGLSSAGVALFEYYNPRQDYAISAASCSEHKPNVYVIDKTANKKYEVDNVDVHFPIDRVTNIFNDGTKAITGDHLYISIYKETPKTVIYGVVLFYESPLSKHKVVASPDGELFNVTLEDFNPGDRISFLVTSDNEVNVGVLVKAPGITTDFRSSTGSFLCNPFRVSGYGGVPAYEKISNGCNLIPNSMNLECTLDQKISIPKEIPPDHTIVVRVQ